MSDEREHRPSLQTARERSESAMESGNLPPVPGLTDRLAAYAADRARVQDQRWSREEQQRRLGEIEAALHPDVEAIVEGAAREATRELDAEEGALRAEAELGAEIDVSVASRAQLWATEVAASDAPSALAAFEEARFAGHADLVRSVGAAVLARLRALADPKASRSPAQADAARGELLAFEAEFAGWRKQHPTPRERLAAIERERYNRETLVREGAKLVLALHGIGRPAPPPQLRSMPEVVEQTGRLREGPAFDALLGRRPGGVRR